jgi:hypothetical protein
MNKMMTALFCAATLAISTMAVPATAQVQRGHDARIYVTEPDHPPNCVWQQQRFWDGQGWVYRRVRICI